MSNSVNLSKLLNTSTTINAEKLSTDIPLGTEDYSTVNDLPATGNQVGDQVFVTETNRLYIWTGQGWYNIALINQTPTWDSDGLPEASYDLDSIGGTATIIQLSATDPEGLPIKWTYSITDSGNDLATISNDSNGTFTVTAKSLADILAAGYDSQDNLFDVTFRASDGVNLATALSEFSISFEGPFVGQPFQGSNYGYSSGGRGAPPYVNWTASIYKFPFATDTNASYSGALTQAREEAAGASSSEYGYSSGGGTPTRVNIIDKFPFVSGGNAADVGDLTSVRAVTTGHSSSRAGYTSGGAPYTTVIDKFRFASDGNATTVGDLIVYYTYAAGQSSSDYGYASGGSGPDSNDVRIKKFPFASDGNAVYTGYLSVGRTNTTGQNSDSYGYTSGGLGGYPPGNVNIIDKFPFASDGNATDVGNLAGTRRKASGQSSTTHGYMTAGYTTYFSNQIDKFSFSSDGNATNIGTAGSAVWWPAGQQY